MINSDFNVFCAFILIGFLIGFIFDFFRILRKVYKTSNFVTVIEDITFWLISGTILLIGIFILNGGKIRAFLFIGIVIGLFLYISVISKYIIKIGVNFLNFINKVILNPATKIIGNILYLLQKIVYNIKEFAKSIYFDFLKHKNKNKRRNF